MSDILPIAPQEIVISQPTSVDNHIVARRQVAIIPREQASFGQQTVDGANAFTNLSDKLTFYISDPRGVLDGMDSYIMGEFEAFMAADQSAAPWDSEGFLDHGGVHACIRAITVRCGSAVLERIEDYAKLYNMVKFATVGDNHLDSVEWAALDAPADFKYLAPTHEYANSLAEHLTALTIGGGATVAVTDAGALTISAGGALLSEVRVGDLIHVVDDVAAAGRMFSTRVTAIASDNAMTVSPAPGVTLTADAGNLIYRDNQNRKYERRSIRNLAVNGVPAEGNATANRLRFSIKPMLKSLQMAKYLPLPLLPAPLEIIIEFNPARLALVARGTSNSLEMGYKISNVKFMASLVEMDQDIWAQYVDMWKNGVIQLPYVTWRRYSNSLAANATTAQYTFQTNLVSAQAAVTVMCDNADTESDVAAASLVKSQSTFKRNGLKRYRYSSGGLKFPEYGDVFTDDLTGIEAFQQLQLTFNTMGNTLHSTQCNPNYWLDGNYESVNLAGNEYALAATKFMMCAPLNKYHGLLSGLDLTHNFLQLDVELQAAVNAVINFKTFILHDAILELSAADGILVKS